MNYHCSLQMIEPERGQSFAPFASAEHMTAMLGISVDEWRRRCEAALVQPRARKMSTKSRIQKEKLFEEFDV